MFPIIKISWVNYTNYFIYYFIIVEMLYICKFLMIYIINLCYILVYLIKLKKKTT